MTLKYLSPKIRHDRLVARCWVALGFILSLLGLIELHFVPYLPFVSVFCGFSIMAINWHRAWLKK